MSFEDPTPEVRRVLAARIKASGLSERELARRAGIPRSSLRRILHGPGELHLRHMARVSEALEISPAALLSSLGAVQAEIRKIIVEVIDCSVNEAVAACARWFGGRRSGPRARRRTPGGVNTAPHGGQDH